jgi:hypothetical protein
VSDDLGKTWRAAETIDASLLKHDWWSVDFTQDGIGVAVSEDAAIALTLETRDFESSRKRQNTCT